LPETLDPTSSSSTIELAETQVLLRPTPSPESRSPESIRVEVIGGPNDGQNVRVSKSTLTIGRAQSNDLRLLDDPMVSAEHARIVRERKYVWLEDVGSRNGTYLGDVRLEARTLLGPGTTFVVGRTEVEYMPT
jgi:pSer/pThr/pTyr-binding forkhead associated (FHA) protein